MSEASNAFHRTPGAALPSSPSESDWKHPARSRGRILLADDEESFRESTAELLTEEGYDCYRVSDASDAIDLLRKLEVDAVIADIRMPGNFQLEVLDKMDELGCDAPVILVTGYPTVGSAVNSLNRGVAGYLIKPFELEALLDLLQRCIPTMRGVRRIRQVARDLKQLADDAEALTRGPSRSGDSSESIRRAMEVAAEGVSELLAELTRASAAIGAAVDRPGRLASRSAQPLTTGTDVEALPELEELTPREHEVLASLAEGDRVSSIARDLRISPNTVRNHLKSIFRKLNVGSQAELLDRLKSARSNGRP